MQFVTGLRDQAVAALAAGRAKVAKARSSAAELTYSLFAKAESTVGLVVGRATGHAKRAVAAVTQARATASARAQEAFASALALAQSSQEAGSRALQEVKTRGVVACTKDAAETARLVAGDSAALAKASATAHAQSARKTAGEAAQAASTKAKELRAATGEVVSRPDFKATAASAAAGSATAGAAGLATGTVAGAAVGGAAGVPLALFTFGLSVPIGAVLGGAGGAVVGVGSGAAFGLVAGGAAGYGAYSKKDEISGAGGRAVGKATEGAEYVKGQVLTTVGYATEAFSAARARLTGGRAGTGGTAGMD